MANYELENFIQTMNSWGITDILLPFILVFTIVFAVLQKAKIFGEGNKKNFNAVISLVMGAGVVIPHVMGTYPEQYDVVNMINNALPQVSIVLIAVLMLMLLIGIWGGSTEWKGGSPAGWIAAVSLVIIVWIFGASAGWWQGWSKFTDFFGEQAIALIVIILIFGVIIWFITKEEKTAPGETFMEKWGNFFKR